MNSPIFIIPLVFCYFLHQSQALHPHLDNTTDQDALLSFKSSVTSDPHRALDSWHPNTSFCLWSGVLCNPIKQRVTGLKLANFSLFGTIPPHISNLSFLQILDLHNNKFSGKIPLQIHRLFRLKVLDLHSNTLHGTIPPWLNRCSMLRFLDLSLNKLTGTIPFELGSLSKLQYLSFEGNKLSGLIPSSFGNLSSLFSLVLGGNHIEGQIPSELGRLNHLLYLYLGNNIISGHFPTELRNMSSLKTMELAMNEISGSLPFDLFNALTNLERAAMGGNMLQGHLPESLSNASNLEILDLSHNQFSGKIPLFWKLEKIQDINLELNFLTSKGEKGFDFITSLTNSTDLQTLTMSTNLLTGQLPPSIGNLSSQFYMLFMSENQLSGNLPQEIGNLDGLSLLSMDTNSFTGEIPSSIGNLKGLQTLYLYDNFLSGSIPETLGNLSILSEIGLNGNNLSGLIPPSLSNCKQLQLFDLSANGLVGNLPKEIFSFTTLGELFNLSSNKFTGSLPPEIGKMTMVQTLDVSKNQLSGEIPSTVEDCLNLKYLDMSRNSFQGPIPRSLIVLRGIEYIDLSSNQLSGKIPPFDGLLYLQYLNLSSNKLQGEVPNRGIFLNVSATFLSNNSELCGGAFEFGLPKCSTYSTGKRRQGKLIAGLVAGAVILCIGIALGFVLIPRWKRRKQAGSIVTDVILFEGPHSHRLYSFFELKYATRNFSDENLIGKGSFGSVYKGIMRDESLIAVKVFNLDQHGAMKSFLSECEVFRNIRHRNLVKILSACSSIDFKALVLELMPNGNLETWLHKRRDGGLNLKQRIEIAMDVAAAMEYLHHGLETPVVHCDLKPNNILLDENMTAYVGDFGLARMLQNEANSTNQTQSSTSRLKGSIGYIAPEYGQGIQISTKGDVYSFGILLLEILTGRSPVDEIFCGEINLQRWVSVAIPDRLVNILDENLEAHSFKISMIDHLVTIINIGLECASEFPDERPEMKDVSTMIKKIWSQLFKEISSSHYCRVTTQTTSKSQI